MSHVTSFVTTNNTVVFYDARLIFDETYFIELQKHIVAVTLLSEYDISYVSEGFERHTTRQPG